MTVLLLDGHNLLYRAFTSLPGSIATRDGTPINGVYGMVGTILRLGKEMAASGAVAAFDVPDIPTFRHTLYPPYQAQRGPLGGDKAADFARQVEIAGEVLPGMGVPVLRRPGFEADDVMASMARRLAGCGETAVIVSTDRDLLQTVGPGVHVMTPANPPVIARTAEDVRDRLGVAPEGVTTFKALAGDASDNIPGVTGIGVKTAVTLVNEYGTLEAIYDEISRLPARVQSALSRDKALAFLFRQVVTVVSDLELPLDAGQVPVLEVEKRRVRDILAAAGYDRP